MAFYELTPLTGRKELFQWFHADGYIYDIFAAVVVLVINLYVALQAVQPLNRRELLTTRVRARVLQLAVVSQVYRSK